MFKSIFHFGVRNIGQKIFPKPLTMCKRNLSTANEELNTAIEIESNLFENSSHIHKPKKMTKPLKQSKPKPLVSSIKVKKPIQQPKELELVNDMDLGVEFARLRTNDSILNNLLTFIRSRKRRDKNRQIIVEGRRLISEALNCGLKMNQLFFSDKEELSLIKDKISSVQKEYSTKIYKIAHHDLKTWSTLSTPPGIMAIFDRPSSKSIDYLTNTLPITVVCDNIREPNNLGSIIRTCAAIPCYQVIVTKGCCDPWDSKALRGGCGGQFRTNIRDDVEWEDLPQYIPPDSLEDYALFIAESNVDKVKNFLGEQDLSEKFISYSSIKNVRSHNLIVIGGETHGISEKAYSFFEGVQKQGTFLHIPLAEGIESLNVNSALTLIVFELRKRLLN